MSVRQTDVLVIGGGPAGTTIANLAAQRGWRVALFEKNRHPRFHIGESLLPMSLPLLERLGVRDAVRNLGVKKHGADFCIGNSGNDYQVFEFADLPDKRPDHAYEVRRAEFDALLFEQCRAAGADTHEGSCVTELKAVAERRIQVTVENELAEPQVWEAAFVVDASGRDTFMAARNGWKQPNPRHASAAIYAHFEDVERRPGVQQGNISIVWFEHGWIWLIPLPGNLMSIGAVCAPAYLRTRSTSLDDFLRQTLEGVGEVRERMQTATQSTPAQATGNYSYRASRKSAPGVLLVGDAFAFIDPVFSSGVFLAMSSAERAMPQIEAWLANDSKKYRLAVRKYSRDIDNAIAAFSWFIYRFTSPAMRYLFSNPRDLLGVRVGVTSMLAGDVFDNSLVRRRLTVFKAFYAIASLLHWRATRDLKKAQRDAERGAIGDQRLAG